MGRAVVRGLRGWGSVPHKTLIILGSAWHREVSGDCDVITAIAFFRCGAPPSSPHLPPSPISLPIMHFRPVFPSTCLSPLPLLSFTYVTSSVSEVSPASCLRISQMMRSHLLSPFYRQHERARAQTGARARTAV